MNPESPFSIGRKWTTPASITSVSRSPSGRYAMAPLRSRSQSAASECSGAGA